MQETLGNSGRVLVRPSGTEKLIRVMVEGQNSELVEKLCNELTILVKKELVSLLILVNAILSKKYPRNQFAPNHNATNQSKLKFL